MILSTTRRSGGLSRCGTWVLGGLLLGGCSALQPREAALLDWPEPRALGERSAAWSTYAEAAAEAPEAAPADLERARRKATPGLAEMPPEMLAELRELGLLFFIMALGLVLPALWQSLAAVIVAGICVGGTFMVITTVGLREAHMTGGSGDAQRHIAAMTAAFAIGQIIGPVIAGWAFELTGSFSYPLMLASLGLVVTIVPMVRLASIPAGREG